MGYMPLKEDYPDMKQTLSDKGKNFKMLHIQIGNFKNWLRGVHSWCNREYKKIINPITAEHLELITKLDKV